MFFMFMLGERKHENEHGHRALTWTLAMDMGTGHGTEIDTPIDFFSPKRKT